LERIRKESGYAWIATAHTGDDQIETLVMRMFQGSGPAGLGGIRSCDGAVVRPLLDVAKRDLELMLDDLDLEPSFETSNHDLHFLRNAVRSKLIPVIREVFPGYVQACGNFSVKQREVADLVAEEASACMWKVYRVDERGIALDPVEFNKVRAPVQERLLHSGWALLGNGGTALSFKSIRYIRDSIGAWKSGDHGFWRCSVQESELIAEGPLLRWRIGTLPVAQGWVTLLCGAWTPLADGYALFRHSYAAGDSDGVAAIDERMLTPPVVARSMAWGDAIQLIGGTVAVSKLVASWNIPKHRRHMVPVLEDRLGICAVLGSAFGGKDRISKRLILPTLAPNSCTLYSVMDMSFAREVGCTCCNPENSGEMDKD
jgi:tRNA(Ile)-lysidine synthase